jgi:hypothetical protein
MAVALSSNSAAFPVPANATVLAGAMQTTLFVTTSAVKSLTQVTITASSGGISQSANATLTPVVFPTLTALSMAPASVKGGSAVVLTVTLSGPAPASGSLIDFTSSSPALVLPAIAEMPAGGVAGFLHVQTSKVIAPTTVTITASSGGTTQTTKLTVTP